MRPRGLPTSGRPSSGGDAAAPVLQPHKFWPFSQWSPDPYRSFGQPARLSVVSSRGSYSHPVFRYTFHAALRSARQAVVSTFKKQAALNLNYAEAILYIANANIIHTPTRHSTSQSVTTSSIARRLCGSTRNKGEVFQTAVYSRIAARSLI